MQAEPEVFAQTLVMTLVSGARSAGQRERCGQKNCKTPALSVVVRMCRYVDVLHTHTCAVTECSLVCTLGSSHRVPETNCVIHSHHHCFSNTLSASYLVSRCSSASLRVLRGTRFFVRVSVSVADFLSPLLTV